MTSIYVAGPMSKIAEFNFPAFDAARDRLAGLGYTAVSPADIDREAGFDPTGLTGNEDLTEFGFSRATALLRDLEEVSSVDYVCVLDGWEDSTGANAEVSLARALGKGVGPIEAFRRGEVDKKALIPAPAVPPALIGLGGKLGAGKDVVADYLVDKYGYTKLGMSDALHEAMLALDPIIATSAATSITYSGAIAMYGYVETKAQFPEARRLLQCLGTEVGRNMLGENTWTDIMRRKIATLQADGKRVVVTGLRFLNELDVILNPGGVTVWVDRPAAEPAPSADPKQATIAAAHASENGVNPGNFEVTITNDGTLEDLYKKIEDWIRS